MKQQLEQRLQSLKSEFDAGQKMLADLEAKQVNLRETLLRISGAIQVLEEELNNASEVADDNNQPPETAIAEVVTNAGDAS
jgi:predicted  nucleic acid-binding Zn-ribbon protein